MGLRTWLYKNTGIKLKTFEAQPSGQQMNNIAVRYLIKARWDAIDSKEHFSLRAQAGCRICGFLGAINSFQKVESECAFYGGHLTRLICPSCGAIFGPLKYFDLTEQDVADDYTLHYSLFSEGDSTQSELRAFHLLKPSKDKVYLNYGSGSWSKSLQILKDQGFTVYGFEPFSAQKNELLITDRAKLAQMRFDGIYSNNLIEHLRDPVTDMKSIMSLLKDDDSLMAHASPCYEYKYEYTRFHVHFFTGKSPEVLARQCGLEIVQKDQEPTLNDFYCCVFGKVKGQ